MNPGKPGQAKNAQNWVRSYQSRYCWKLNRVRLEERNWVRSAKFAMPWRSRKLGSFRPRGLQTKAKTSGEGDLDSREIGFVFQVKLPGGGANSASYVLVCNGLWTRVGPENWLRFGYSDSRQAKTRPTALLWFLYFFA